MRFEIQPYNPHDKSFTISGPIDLIIDNDDVPHDAVAALAHNLVECLNHYWQDPTAWTCHNEDCENYWRFDINATGDCPLCKSILYPETVSL